MMEDYGEKILTSKETRRSFLDRLGKVTAGALVGAAAPKGIEAQRLSEDISSGKSYFIDANPDDDEATGESSDTAFKSLEKVWHLLKPGDTVYLNGTFVGQDLCSTVSGTADKPITFTSFGSEKATLDRGRNGGLIYLEGTPDNPLSNIIVKNLRLTNSNYKETDAPAMVGVHLQNTEGVTIEACEMEYVGTFIENSRQFKILNNTIEKVAAFDKEGRPCNEYHAIRISIDPKTKCITFRQNILPGKDALRFRTYGLVMKCMAIYGPTQAASGDFNLAADSPLIRLGFTSPAQTQ